MNKLLPKPIVKTQWKSYKNTTAIDYLFCTANSKYLREQIATDGKEKTLKNIKERFNKFLDFVLDPNEPGDRKEITFFLTEKAN